MNNSEEIDNKSEVVGLPSMPPGMPPNSQNVNPMEID